MIIKKVSLASTNRLYLGIDANLSSLRKRGIMYTIIAHSTDVATVNLFVNGRKGVVMKDIVFVYDNIKLIWNVYSEGTKYEINSLTEIPYIFKSMISIMSVTVNKI